MLVLLAAAVAAPAAPGPSFRAPRLLPSAVREALAERSAPLLADGSRTLQRLRLAGESPADTLSVVVLLCDFADSLLYGRYGSVPGEFPLPRQSDFYYAAHDSLFFAHQFADVAAYFDAVSGGRLTVRCAVVGAVANLTRPMGWYGNHPVAGEQSVLLARDVVAALDNRVDFSRYDTVVIVHAGAGEETDLLNDSPEQIYSTYLSPEDFARAADDTALAQPYLPTDDVDSGGEPVVVNQVLVLPETEFQDPFAGFGGYFGSLGVYCFEVGLRLGMLSLSDFTPAGHPDSQGVGEFDLMGYGLFVGAGFIPCQPSAFNKLLMGWIEPYAVEPGAGVVWRLDPIESAAGDSLAARVEIGGREYWLLEYRLQDPDGNRIFSFAGDLNGNNIPDFLDANSANGDGTPTGFFDPATDTRELLTGAEWDFFMSENQARQPGVKGAGSGLYVWHVDEGVITDAIEAEGNLFNSDPRRKSVDLEEADGIQDLDSREPSEYMLGGDFDSFRGEDNATFGPTTNPDSRSAGGAWTGVVIDQIGNVVADSSAISSVPPRIFIRYAAHLTFRCRRDEPDAGPLLYAERRLDGVDLAGSHLLAVDLDAPPDGRLEIVAGGARGEVFAFEPDLSEQYDGDATPATSGILALGTDADGVPVRWNGPAAAGDLDGDGRQEIVLCGPHGLYAFNGEDGRELADGDDDPDSFGLLAPLEHCALPPVLMPAAGDAEVYDPGRSVVACVVETYGEPSQSRLRWFDAGGRDALPPLLLGAVSVPAPPTPVAAARLALAVVDTAAGESTLRLVTWSPPATPVVAATWPLSLTPGALPLLAVVAEGPLRGAVIVDAEGAAETLWWNGSEEFVRRDAWPTGSPVCSPLSAGGAYVGQGSLARVTVAGAPRTGWPMRPRPEMDAAPAAMAPAPLEARSAGRDLTLFQSRDGRLYLSGADGLTQAGWPVAGPSAVAGTGLFIDLDGDSSLEICAVGAFARIEGRNVETGGLRTDPVSRLAIYRTGIVAEGDDGPGWSAWQGNPWRWPLPRPQSVAPTLPELIMAGSHICYPTPLERGPLRVRAEFGAACVARATLYDLTGQQVSASAVVAIPGRGPGEIVLSAEGLASGLYLCRLVAERTGLPTGTSIAPVAVAR
jgi:M6 family metalloprotease-like protein